jgi:mRNA interferase RelE/StbE
VFAVEIFPAALRALAALPRPVQERIRDRVEALAENPWPPGAKKLSGQKGHWRVRVGEYRVIYRVDTEVRIVLVSRIGHRREVYR